MTETLRLMAKESAGYRELIVFVGMAVLTAFCEIICPTASDHPQLTLCSSVRTPDFERAV